MKNKRNFGIMMTFTVLMSGLSACTATPKHDELVPKIGMPNPASQFCVEQGGKLEIRNERDGQVGYCHLPNGQVVEEWELFRSQSSS